MSAATPQEITVEHDGLTVTITRSDGADGALVVMIDGPYDRGTAVINGERKTAPDRAVAYKYADPTEDGRWLYDKAEMREISAEDPSLIVPVEHADTNPDGSPAIRVLLNDHPIYVGRECAPESE